MNKSMMYTVRDAPDKGRELGSHKRSKKDKKYFFALHNIYTADELPQELGIIRTNALPLGKEAVEAAVYRVVSRINHSCAPNVKHSWNSITQKEYIYAIEDIAAGSEILTSYIDPLMTREARLKKLKEDFRFTCQCRLCAAASSKEYDAAVTRIHECSDLIVTFASSNPRKAMENVREVLALIDKIGAPCKTPFYYDGFQIMAMYSNFKLAKNWADLLLESYRIEEGETGDQYGTHLAHSVDVKSHECAGRRRYIDLSDV
ncbi:hypothetical protein EC991_010264 [Linnemannia zychae]|nr:hypothetical protein EC991_010264 [Linnemannia zychae]